MKKFMVIYYAPKEAVEMTQNMTPEQMKAGMQEWFDWMEEVKDHLVDPGSILSNGLNVSSSENTQSSKDVNGYSILQAESLDDAAGLVKDHPHLNWAPGCEVELYEVMPMPTSM